MNRAEALAAFKEEPQEVQFVEDGVEYRLAPDKDDFRGRLGKVVIGAFVDGQEVGHCMTDVHNVHNALQVEVDYRRRGIARVLDAVKVEIDGRNKFELVGDSSALKFYINLGYVPVALPPNVRSALGAHYVEDMSQDTPLEDRDRDMIRQILEYPRHVAFTRTRGPLRSNHLRLEYKPEEAEEWKVWQS